MHEHFVTFDPPAHTDHRALLMRLITPKRLKENEAFMWALADRQLDEFLSAGRCEFIKEYAQPFALLVVADLLGVPEADHELFRDRLGAQRPGDIATTDDEWSSSNPLEFLDAWFSSYVEDRRRAPRDDVLSGLATATFPDGSIPDVLDVVRIATFLFAAGQETTARLLSSALQLIAENPDIQQRLREERDRIPNFVEEVLRMESPVKSDFRMARRTTTLAGVDVAAGTTVMMLNGAANRDPRRFECPHEFQVDRENARQHIAFGHGIHTCPGAPLARAETRISLERIFDRMADIRISDAEHGPATARRYDYEPTYILRGLSSLHLEFTPVDEEGRDGWSGTVSDFDAIDFFTDESLVADPYGYFDFVRARCPVQREQHRDVVMVTGYDEAIAVYHDTASFSSCNSVSGPFPGFPVPLEGDDVSDLIEQHRDDLPMNDQLVTFDPPKHTDHRALLMRLITPKRLKENEAFMWRLADRQIDEFIDQGRCEFISEFASPFALLVIADLLGVPEEDHAEFRSHLGAGRPGQALGSTTRPKP